MTFTDPWPVPPEGWRELDSIGEPVTSSWGTAVPLGPILRGERTRPAPTFLTRSDGKAALTLGKVSSLIGESEGTKTWVALVAIREALLGGFTAAFLDFEDDEVGITERLVALGVAAELIETRFFYLLPDGRPNLGAFTDAFLTPSLGLVVVDALTAAFASSGVDGNRDVEVTEYLNAFAKPLARLGPAVLLLDHLGKDSTKGARGSSAKRDAVSGVQLTALKRSLVTPGGRGVTSLHVTKDRLGSTRAVSLTGLHFADVILDATDPGGIVVSIEPPLANAHAAATERVARAIAALDPSPENPVTTKAVQDKTGEPYLKLRTVQEALAELHASGQVGRRMVGRTSLWWLS